MNSIFWLTGNCETGKTTLARAVKANRPCIILDGDEMRATISVGLGFSAQDRIENNVRIARLAALLASQGHLVIVSVVAPFVKLRSIVDAICQPYWIHVKRTVSYGYDSPYEPPEEAPLTIDNDVLSREDARKRLLEFIDGTRFSEPWTHGVSSLNHNNA